MKKAKNKKPLADRYRSPESSKSRRWFFVFIVAALLLVAVVGLRYSLNSERRSLLNSLSQLKLDGIEPQVARKIRTLVANVKNNQSSAASWGTLAMNLDAHDFKKEAMPVYGEASKLDPANFRWVYFPALALSELREQEALDFFERAAQMNPQYVPLIVKQGDAFYQFGRIDRAEKNYRQALSYDPNCAQAEFGLARISYLNRDLISARTHLERVLQLNPEYSEASGLLISICRQMKSTDCSVKDPTFFKDQKTEISDPVYSELVAEGESSIWYRFRGSNYYKNGLHNQAINEFQTALSLRPDAQTHEDLAHALSAAGKFDEAARHYHAALQNHDTANNYFGLALAQARLERYAEAEQNFVKAIERNPNLAEAHFNLSVLYAKSGQAARTIEKLKQAIQIKPDYTEAHYHLGLAYREIHDRKAALQQYEILSKLDSKRAAQLYQLIQKME